MAILVDDGPEWMPLWDQGKNGTSNASTLAAETFSVSPGIPSLQFFSHSEVVDLCGLLINVFPEHAQLLKYLTLVENRERESQ